MKTTGFFSPIYFVGGPVFFPNTENYLGLTGWCPCYYLMWIGLTGTASWLFVVLPCFLLWRCCVSYSFIVFMVLLFIIGLQGLWRFLIIWRYSSFLYFFITCSTFEFSAISVFTWGAHAPLSTLPCAALSVPLCKWCACKLHNWLLHAFQYMTHRYKYSCEELLALAAPVHLTLKSELIRNLKTLGIGCSLPCCWSCHSGTRNVCAISVGGPEQCSQLLVTLHLQPRLLPSVTTDLASPPWPRCNLDNLVHTSTWAQQRCRPVYFYTLGVKFMLWRPFLRFYAWATSFCAFWRQSPSGLSTIDLCDKSYQLAAKMAASWRIWKTHFGWLPLMQDPINIKLTRTLVRTWIFY